MPDGWRAPVAKSTIVAVPGAGKYNNPDKIIEDNRQLRKFFGEFVWNYFRQQINENKRKEHRKDPIHLLGDTDYIITQEILSLCGQMGVDHNYCHRSEPKDGKYTIRIFGLLTPPEFTAELAQLKAKADLFGVPVTITSTTIEIAVTPDAPQLPIVEKKDDNWKKDDDEKVTQWQALVYRPEHVSVLNNPAYTADEQESDFTLTQVSYRTVGGERMGLEDHVATTDNNEGMRIVRGSSPGWSLQRRLRHPVGTRGDLLPLHRNLR
jgi:hypothetical protein